MDFELEVQEEKKATTNVRKYVTNIWGKIKNKKETELSNTVNGVKTVIGKYWVCAQTVFFGVRPTRQYDTKEEAQKVIPKLYNLGVEGNFVIAKDVETNKFYIKAN